MGDEQRAQALTVQGAAAVEWVQDERLARVVAGLVRHAHEKVAGKRDPNMSMPAARATIM